MNKYGFLDWPEMRERSQEILDQLGVEIDLKMPVAQLGVARQQLIEIAKALSIDASLIIMDEPTAALSTEEIVRFFNVIRQLKSQDVTIIFITHHMNEIFEIADRSTRSTDEIVLSVQNLNRKGILKDINFSLKKGEILGIAGLMGPGIHIYLLDEPTCGIDVGGKEMIFETIHRLVDESASVILISSELEEIIRMSDRVIVTQMGQINGEFSKNELDLEKILLCAKGKQFETGEVL